MSNLSFFTSLSGLKECSLFGLAKGANINNMTSAALFAEVKAYDAILNPPKPWTETTSDQAKALYSNIHDQRGGSNRGNHRGGGSNRGGSRAGSRAGKGRKNDFDPNKYCAVHGRQGHDAEHCRKAAYDKKQEEEGGNGPRKSDRPYQPSFERYQMSVKVTRFTANNTQIEPAHDPHEWIVDSAANAYITSFKHTLHNYVEFPQAKKVKGFRGKNEKAYGQGSIILIDSQGYEKELEDVVYVPDSPDQILSLMKFRRQHSTEFQL